MELYILSISGEQICNAKHWIQDETHGYKEAIRTKLIKQDPGLSTADRILNRNKKKPQRGKQTKHRVAHQPDLPWTTWLPLQKADHSPKNSPRPETPTSQSLHFRSTLRKTLGSWVACCWWGSPLSAAVIHMAKDNWPLLYSLQFSSTVPQVRKLVWIISPASHNLGHMTFHATITILKPNPVWQEQIWSQYERNQDRHHDMEGMHYSVPVTEHREMCFDSSLSTAGSHTQSHLLALLFMQY